MGSEMCIRDSVKRIRITFRLIERNVTFDKPETNEIKFKMNINESGVKSINSMEKEMLIGHQNRMQKESQVLDSGQYYGKVHNMQARNLVQSQNQMISSLISKPDNNAMIQIEYFDTLLNLERKAEHFSKLFNKIRLRVIHKPFIICLLYTSPSPRDGLLSRMPSSA